MDARKINEALLHVFLRFRKGQYETAPKLTEKVQNCAFIYTAIVTVLPMFLQQCA